MNYDIKDYIELHKKLAEQFRPLMGRESCFRTIPEGFDVRRDKENAGYRASIRDFMKEIGQGNCIIVAISDKYLKSENCMFEMFMPMKRQLL